MVYRRTHRPVREMTLDELQRESDLLEPLIRDVTTVKQARKRVVDAEIARRVKKGQEKSKGDQASCKH